MKLIRLLTIFSFLLVFVPGKSNADNSSPIKIAAKYAVSAEQSQPVLIFTDTIKHKENKKLAVAILAFPLPFGIVGLHRIYLGTEPIIPLAYIATFGGCFGVLPFIDFVMILLSDETMMLSYEKNKKMFMWVK